MSLQDAIFVTDQDHHRLSALVSQMEGPLAEALDEELSRAHIVNQKEIPADIVTMNSQLLFKNELTGEELKVTLVYPHEANFEKGRISILAPVGVALLGLRVGQSIDWRLPSGEKKKFKVIEISYQPEAHGDWNL